MMIWHNFSFTSLMITLSSLSETTRGCFYAPNKEPGCQTNGDTTQCYCPGNYCNSASSLSTGFFVAISSILMYFIL